MRVKKIPGTEIAPPATAIAPDPDKPPPTFRESQRRAGGAFRLVSEFTPQGDQPSAIRALVGGLRAGQPDQVLLGVTGSGKTFTMAKVIEEVNRPTLVLSHNK